MPPCARVTANVKRMIERLSTQREWANTGQGWQAKESLLRLEGWSRQRGDSENIFDELKNQWGWGGFVTQDLARCRLAARMIALFYDWWSIFVRLVEPDRHMEAITSRPLLLHAIAMRVRHARQTLLVAGF